MFRQMRRKDRLLSAQEAMEILSKNAYGILSVIGEEGFPYGVPMHYALVNNELYFHCAKAGGLKTECIERNPKVCFTVVEPLEGVKCRSAILYGKMEQDPTLSAAVLNNLIEKFVPQQAWEQAKSGVPYAKDNIIAFRLPIEHISAKVIDKPENR